MFQPLIVTAIVLRECGSYVVHKYACATCTVSYRRPYPVQSPTSDAYATVPTSFPTPATACSPSA